MTTTEEPHVQDAAMSLCALGRRSISPSDSGDGGKLSSAGNRNASSSAVTATDAANDDRGNQLKIPEDPQQPQFAPPSEIDKNAAAPANKKVKYNVKPRDPKRETSVAFDEMKRLMRVYGSLKCLRNRTPVDSGKAAKVESIKRKFYRWFPDLDERFERTPEGWYRPRAGHEEEMKYREAMRKEDQESLVRKRNTKRTSAKPNAPTAV